MHISAKADYAVRALVELAAHAEQPLTCEGIASAQEIPFRFLKSVFRQLRQAGLVRSQRGCEGGYWLGRDAERITLAEIMVAVDGDFMTLRGERLDALDYPGAAGTLPDVWRAVEAAADALLGRITLAQLLCGGGLDALPLTRDGVAGRRAADPVVSA
ncbi:RrF2 family transcriptional regulator [Streptomyces sp. NPDC059373]